MPALLVDGEVVLIFLSQKVLTNLPIQNKNGQKVCCYNRNSWQAFIFDYLVIILLCLFIKAFCKKEKSPSL